MLFILVVVVGVVMYYGYFGNTKKISNSKNDVNEMLKVRFVNGEIDEQTYLQMKETLKK